MKYKKYDNWPRHDLTHVDFTPSLMNVVSFHEIIDKLCELVPSDIDYIVSPSSQGFVWGTAVALQLNKGFIPLQKEGKIPTSAIMSSYGYHNEHMSGVLTCPRCYIYKKRCFFIDDVISSASTYRACKTLIDTLGSTLCGGAVIYAARSKTIKQIKYIYNVDTLPDEQKEDI